MLETAKISVMNALPLPFCIYAPVDALHTGTPCDTSRRYGPRAVAGSARTWFEDATLDLKDPLDLKNRVGMNLAKLSANGQITVPAEVRRRLHLVAGDQVLFVEGPNGAVV